MKLEKKTTRQLSIAVGLLSLGAFVIQGLGDIWGFQAIAKQLTATALLVAGAVNVHFSGVTSEKNRQDKKMAQKLQDKEVEK